MRHLAGRAGLGYFVPDDLTRDEAGAAIDDLLCGRLPEFAQGWGLEQISPKGSLSCGNVNAEPIDDEQANRDCIARIRELDALGAPKNEDTGLFIKELLPERLSMKYRTENQWRKDEGGKVRPGALPIEMHPQKRYRSRTSEYFHVDDVAFPGDSLRS